MGAATLARRHVHTRGPATADRRRRVCGLALHPEPVLRRRVRRPGRHLPRRQRASRRNEPVQRVRQDRYPDVGRACQRCAADPGHDHGQRASRCPAHRAEHPAWLPVPAGVRRGAAMGGGQAQAAQGQEEGARPDGGPHRHPALPPQAGRARLLRSPARDVRMTAATAHSGAGAQAAPGPPVAMPRGRRSTELLMLTFAVGVVLAAYASAGLGLNGNLPAGLIEYGLAFAALVFVAHLAVRRLAPWADPLMLPLAALLNGLGIVMIYRQQESGRAGNPGSKIITMSASTTAYQVVWSAIGIAAFIAVLVIIREPRVLQRYTYTLGALGLLLLAIPALLPASVSEVNGAKVWIKISGFSIQPGEFAKLALAVFFAGYLVAKRDVLALAGRRVLGIDLPRGRDLGPVLIAWGASLLILIFETDIGTSALFFGLFVAMIYVATQRTSWLLIGIGLFAAGAYAASILSSHVAERFSIWLDPFGGNNPLHSSFQLVQGLEGMGFGGILGTGLGHGEELGLTGLMAILLIFGLIVQRGLRAAILVRDPFAKLLAGGLAFVLALQVFVIVGGVTGLIPLTGVTTPFLSQGGSSLVASWAMIGLLMRISDTARRPAPQPIQDEGMTQIVRA